MYKYMNIFTGAIYKTFFDALKSAIVDFIHYPKCRNIRMFHIKKGEW